MNIKDILEKIAKSLKHPLDTDNNSLYDEKNPHVIIPKTEQETRDDYLKSYTSLFETYKFPDIEEVLDEVIFIQRGEILLKKTVDEIREEHEKSVDELFREVFRW